MGLAVVHGIIDSCGGGITVDSEPEKGTVFTIYLPIIQKRGEVPPGTERVLLVDKENFIIGHSLFDIRF